ncbi:hypothetical protein JKA74_15715 [Marivirga sp. S37H4]|uniref:Uncharacterized protein n=1 Tax=Marivirga aurantiaca TaxID=2802615 RepID=A0A934X0Z3_9BACT|nr:hypothetical protein [Marivirga aurantiaca]MBK6266492.1 hypothetical protein [Marivirga aurantiaca]
MIRYTPYQLRFIIKSGLFLLLFSACTLVSVQAQKANDKKLESSEKVAPSKMNEKKVKTSRRSKAKGNPNKGGNKVIVTKPAKWDWNKVMWFKAKKSDYKTKDYNPNKRTKRKQYDNPPNYQSENRQPGDSDVKLKKPLIPFDSRTADEGPVLIKKRKPQKLDLSAGGPQVEQRLFGEIHPDETVSKKRKDKKGTKIDGDKLYNKKDGSKRKPYDNDKVETSNQPDYSGKMDNKRLMISTSPDYKSNKMDGEKLMTIKKGDTKPKPYDNSKLMVSNRPDFKSNKMDDDKLMTIRKDKSKPKPYDVSKLMYVKVSKPEKQSLHDDKLMVKVPKIERSKLHGDKLLTVPERHYPTATMKRIAEDIAKYEGDYERKIKVSKDSHPASRYMAAKSYRVPWLKRTQISLSLFWSGLWDSNIQPSSVTDKKPKLRRDKKEGQIWDNTVHPSEWKKTEEKAESGNN